MSSNRLTSKEVRLRLARHYLDICAEAARRFREGIGIDETAKDLPNILNAQHAADELADSLPEASQLCWQFPFAVGVVGVSLIGMKELIRWNERGRTAAKWTSPVELRMKLDLQLCANLGFLYSMSGDLHRSSDYYNVARYLAGKLNDRSRVGEIAGHLGEVLCEVGEYAAASQLLEQSRDCAADATPRERAVAEFRLGHFHRLTGQVEVAADFFRIAAEIAQSARLDDLRSRVLSEFAAMLQQTGDYRGSIRLYEASLQMAEVQRDPNLEGRLTAAMADSYFYADDLGAARTLYAKAIAIFGRTGDQVSDGRTHSGIGAVLTRQGNMAEALAYFKRSLEIAQQCGDQQGCEKALQNLATLISQMGDKEDSAALRSEASTILHDFDHRTRRTDAGRTLSERVPLAGLTRNIDSVRGFQRIHNMLRSATMLLKRREYHNAALLVEAAISLDPTNSIAKELVDRLKRTEDLRVSKERRYHLLVDQKFLSGLAAQEREELDRLFAELSEFDREFYEPLIDRLRQQLGTTESGS